MTDYNDGKWHGWNGGQCPVHPKSVVVIQRKQDTRIDADKEDEDDVWTAGKWDWNDDGDEGDIIAFRVIKPYREPKEVYLKSNLLLGCLIECKPSDSGATLFREVLTTDPS